MKETGGTIGGSIHSVPVALANRVTLTTPGFGARVYPVRKPRCEQRG